MYKISDEAECLTPSHLCCGYLILTPVYDDYQSNVKIDITRSEVFKRQKLVEQ